MTFLQYLKKLYYTDRQYYLSLPKRFFRNKKYLRDKTLYLHVGMDKTGTSAIQAFLHQNAEQLFKTKGILRPSTALWGDYSHHPLAFSLLEIQGYTKANLVKYLRALEKEILTAPNVILSSECLFKTTQHKNFKHFRTFIRTNFSDVRIIVYVRRQDEWVESRHKHSVLSGQTLSLEKLTKEHFCNYKKFIDMWRDTFPTAHIIVRPYEKSQFKGGNIFSDFAYVLGIDSFTDFSTPAREVNMSLDNVTTAYKALCNSIRFTGGSEHELNSLLLEYTKLQKDKRKKQHLLSADARKLLLEQYDASNTALAKEYLSGQKALFQDVEWPIDNEWEEYKGISVIEGREIHSFIQQKNPALSKKLQKQISLSCTASEPVESIAAKQLQSFLT